MVFSSATFLFLFLPVVLGVYTLLGKTSFRNVFLLFASLFFYAWGEKVFVLLMVFSIMGNYSFGLLLQKYRGRERAQKVVVVLAAVLNLGILGWYKYSFWIFGKVYILSGIGDVSQIPMAPPHLPIGISFFTFQALSYVIDVYRGEADAQKNPLNVGLYISMFPQLIAGPIVRYRDIASQITNRSVSLSDYSYGVSRFILGLGKKMILANSFGETADAIFLLEPAHLTAGVAWLGIVCYTLQIYFDFSGYSDMAIGLGRMFGFRYLENFNYPYISQSVQEFWRRWHISLSSWFRDYLYIPLGGSRKSPARTYANLLIVFFLCGLWHGASLKFIIWGLYHGLFLVIERMWLGAFLKKIWSPLRHIYALLVISIGWVFFRAESQGQAMTYISTLFGQGTGNGIDQNVALYMNMELAIILVVGLIASTPIAKSVIAYREKLSETGGHLFAERVSGVLSCSLLLAGATYNPFIYFRF